MADGEDQKLAERFRELVYPTCDRCKTPVNGHLHSCPYKSEIHDDDKTLCNCCSGCAKMCADEI